MPVDLKYLGVAAIMGLNGSVEPVDAPILLIGQSLTVGLYNSQQSGSDAAETQLLADLATYAPDHSWSTIRAADGGTYISQTSNTSADAWWDDTVEPQAPALALNNAVAAVASSGKTPKLILSGIGESESNRIKNGVNIDGVNYTQTPFSGWATSSVERFDLADGSVIIRDSGGSTGTFVKNYTASIGDPLELDFLVKKTSSDQYMMCRIEESSTNRFIIVNLKDGLITRSGGSLESESVTDNGDGFWRVTITHTSGIAQTDSYRIAPAYSSDGYAVDASQTGSIIIKDLNPELEVYALSIKSQVKSAQLSIFNHLRSLYGEIPVFIQKIGRREPTATLGYSNVGGAQIIREIHAELIAEYDWIYDAGEIYDYEILKPDNTNVHGTDADYIKAAKRHARAIANQYAGASVDWEGIRVNSVTNTSDAITLNLSDSNISGDYTPATNEASFLRIFKNGEEIIPTSLTASSGDLVATFAAGILSDAVQIDAYIAYDPLTRRIDSTAYHNLNITNVPLDANNLPIRATHWRFVNGWEVVL